MSNEPKITNMVKDRRASLGWSQEQLAERAGLSRAAVSAIEIGRVVPSTAAALALARVFQCSVEDLFVLGEGSEPAFPWAVRPPTREGRAWLAAFDDETKAFPCESTWLGTVAHDAVWDGGGLSRRGGFDPRRTLIVAGCDPSVGLLAAELLRDHDVRLIALRRTSGEALALLRAGSVHVAGVHLQGARSGNDAAVRAQVGSPCRLLHGARWQEGLALAAGLSFGSITGAVSADLTWVARQPGSGARKCADALLKDRRTAPRGYDRVTNDHRSLAEAIRSGWAQAGVCVRLAAEEAGLGFLSIREEDYDLCHRRELDGDPRLAALHAVMKSARYRRALADLPGYNVQRTGDVTNVE